MKGTKFILTGGATLLVFAAILAGVIYVTRSTEDEATLNLSASRRSVLSILDRMPIIDG